MVGEQVELIQDEQHGAAAAAITWCETPKSNRITHLWPLNLDDSIISDAFSTFSDLSSKPPARKPDSLQNSPEIKQKQVFCSTFIASLTTKLPIKLLPNTYKHFVADNVFQVELPRYFF